MLASSKSRRLAFFLSRRSSVPDNFVARSKRTKKTDGASRRAMERTNSTGDSMREVSHLIILGDKSLMKSIWRRHLIICLFPWAAGGSHLPPGSGVHRRKRRGQLDHPGFPGAYLLDLHRVACHPRHLKVNCRPVISPVRSVAHSLWLNGAFPDPARRRLRRLRKSPARNARRQRAHHLVSVYPDFSRNRNRGQSSLLGQVAG